MMRQFIRIAGICLLAVALAACAGNRRPNAGTPQPAPATGVKTTKIDRVNTTGKRSTIWDIFNTPNANTNIRVNRYIWNAALDTLSFLPLEAADPFTGVMVMGWGRAPGSGQQYRATIYVQDPALDAASLRVSVQRRSGSGTVPASAETTRQIENAILTRARQLRIAAAKR